MADRTDPRDALAAIERTEGRLATRMHWPLHRHAAAGVLQALFVVAWALPLPYMGALFAVAVAMMTLIAEADRKRDGMFVSGMVSKSGMPPVLRSSASSPFRKTSEARPGRIFICRAYSVFQVSCSTRV